MGGFGYIVGGALQGLGQGMAAQGQADAASRREAALEALRTQNRRAEVTMDADLRDRNDARSTQRDTNKQITVGKANTQNSIIVDGVRTNNDIKLKSVDLANSKSLARLNAALDTQKDAASQRLRESLSTGDITQTFEADDGQIWGLTKGGQRVSTGVFFAPKTLKDGEDGSGLISRARGERDGSGGTAAPAPAPQPKTKPAAGNAQAPAAKPKTYSSAEVKNAAKQLGWSEQQVRDWAKANGWKLTN